MAHICCEERKCVVRFTSTIQWMLDFRLHIVSLAWSPSCVLRSVSQDRRKPSLNLTRDQELVGLPTEAMKGLSGPEFQGLSYTRVFESVFTLNDIVMAIKEAFPSCPTGWIKLQDSVLRCELFSYIVESY
jgi:hypothetical protein